MNVLTYPSNKSLCEKVKVSIIAASIIGSSSPIIVHAGVINNQKCCYKISESGENSNIYKYCLDAGMYTAIPTYDIKNNSVGGDAFMEPKDYSVEKLKINEDKLKGFLKLEEDWNSYGAHPFTTQLIDKIIPLLYALSVQPDIFPTGRKSIQMEYEKPSGEYLEFEIFDDGKMGVLYIDPDSEEIEEDYDYDIDLICKKVDEFYG